MASFTREDFDRVMISPKHWVGEIHYPETRKHKEGLFFTVNACSNWTPGMSVQAGYATTTSPFKVEEYTTIWVEFDPASPESTLGFPESLASLVRLDYAWSGEQALMEKVRNDVLKLEQLAMYQRLAEKIAMPKPTFIVDSGKKSLHFFWRLAHAATAQAWQAASRSMVAYFLADPVALAPNACARVGGVTCANGREQKIVGGTGSTVTINSIIEALDRTSVGCTVPREVTTWESPRGWAGVEQARARNHVSAELGGTGGAEASSPTITTSSALQQVAYMLRSSISGDV
jgi:hypothetical protein